ncbi:MAG: DUF4411 family protein [Thermoanaerobaculia bacterium]
MAYLLDSDVFIRAKNLHYGLDFCPAFWEWLIVSHSEGLVRSIEKVADEIEAGGDELSAWAAALPDTFFTAADATTVPSLRAVSQWATSGYYEPSAASTFLQVADYYLVSQALAGAHTIVTHEVPSSSTRKIKIPDACLALGIKYVTPYEMLRKERARFVLG